MAVRIDTSQYTNAHGTDPSARAWGLWIFKIEAAGHASDTTFEAFSSYAAARREAEQLARRYAKERWAGSDVVVVVAP